MFADDINLFFSYNDVNVLLCFKKIKEQLTNISNWFNANKLLLNVKNTNHSLFHKSSSKKIIPLQLRNLKINVLAVDHETSIKFLGVWRDEKRTWADDIHAV